LETETRATRLAEEERLRLELEAEVEEARAAAAAAEEKLKLAQELEASELAKERARLDELERMEAIAESFEEEGGTSGFYTTDDGGPTDKEALLVDAASIDSDTNDLETPVETTVQERAAAQVAALGLGSEELSGEAQIIADTIAKSDESYVPSEQAMVNTEILLQEVTGHTLNDYNDKEAFFTGHNIGVYSGSALSIPIRVSTPGTFVEYTIEKKAYDFRFGIVAFLDQGLAIKIKVCAKFLTSTN
jgi:hypothetical protein